MRPMIHGGRTPRRDCPQDTHCSRLLPDFPTRRMPIAPLLDRMWQLRNNITPYDGAYVALAERLDATLLTCDAKLAAASGAKCEFDLIS
jgi:predicted nucleic acid-binding protein